jgi:osmotically-inducible protein OsmY
MNTTKGVLCFCTVALLAGCATRQSTYRVDYDEPPIIDTTAQAAAEADRALADLVRAQFNRYGDLSRLAPNVNISARNGMVTLTGDVPSDQDRRMVVAMVESTPGVVTLNDQLRVTLPGDVIRPAVPTGRIDTQRFYPGDAGEVFNLHVQGLSETDRTLAQRVLDGLRTDSVVASMLPVVNIHVSDGRVVLRGSVLNDEQRRSIVSAVQRAAGVNNVYDELQIRPLR